MPVVGWKGAVPHNGPQLSNILAPARNPEMKLSIVIICWNDRKVIEACLKSIFDQPPGDSFEVIVSDNGSTDDSVAYIRATFPMVTVLENGANLGFAKGNNVGIRAARGDYVLILNPDTILHYDAVHRLLTFADVRPKAGAFGCRVLNPDGSDQLPAAPLPTLQGALVSALCLRWLGRVSPRLLADWYPGWEGTTEREIGRQSGCCILVRRSLLTLLDGFDERFFYHCEETDLCCRIWAAGSKVLFCPDAVITHLGGQSVGRFPIRFALETYRSRYRYFHKHYGERGVQWFRLITLLHIELRHLAYGALWQVSRSAALENRLAMYRVVLEWNRRVDPLRFVSVGDEPDLGYAPMAPPSATVG